MGILGGRMGAMSKQDPFDDPADEDPAVLLAQARDKAARLLKQLIADQEEIDRNPPKISAEALEEGRAAMANAIAAAGRTIEAIDAAMGIAGDASERTSGDDGHHWN